MDGGALCTNLRIPEKLKRYGMAYRRAQSRDIASGSIRSQGVSLPWDTGLWTTRSCLDSQLVSTFSPPSALFPLVSAAVCVQVCLPGLGNPAGREGRVNLHSYPEAQAEQYLDRE